MITDDAYERWLAQPKKNQYCQTCGWGDHVWCVEVDGPDNEIGLIELHNAALRVEREVA